MWEQKMRMLGYIITFNVERPTTVLLLVQTTNDKDRELEITKKRILYQHWHGEASISTDPKILHHFLQQQPRWMVRWKHQRIGKKKR